MVGRVYYNENDKFAAQWLRNLISAGHLPDGFVDKRDIRDVRPSDLDGYEHCHFFAGIGGWPLALRLARWPEGRPVWTGSCPCQPFSQAGKGAGFADERHLWPAFHHLIRECRPDTVFGEQVASKDGLAWLDLVSADLEGEDYTFGALDTCAAGVGAPHIRQRSYWVADTANARQFWRRSSETSDGRGSTRLELERFRATRDVADVGGERLEGRYKGAMGRECPAPERSGGELSRLGDSECLRTGRNPGASVEAQGGSPLRPKRDDIGPSSSIRRLADVPSDGRGEECSDLGGRSIGDRAQRLPAGFKPSGGDLWAGSTNGFWRDVDWLFCRDVKWRPVRPGSFPLAHGATSRVGRLRAYGNAINVQQAQVFIEAYLECL